MTWNAASLDMPGGSCAGPAFITIIGPGCVFPIPYVTSSDEDGNGQIALADLARWQTAFVGGGVPRWDVDLNRDGLVGLPDLGFLQRHFVAP